MIYEEPIAPTVTAIDEWMAQEEANKPEGAVFATDYDNYMVNIWTKAGSCRCITSKQHGMGIESGIDRPGWWTIRGEGSSNGCRETWVSAHRVVRAVGIIVGERDERCKASAAVRER